MRGVGVSSSPLIFIASKYKFIKKILVIRFSSIGDIVLTSPVIRVLKNQLNAEIHFVSKGPFKSIMEFNPHIAKTWVYSKEDNRLIQNLKDEKFDLVLDLQKNISSKKICSSLAIKNISFDKKNVKKWFYVNFKYPPLNIPHLVDRYFEATSELGIKNDGKGLEFHIDPSIENSTKEKDYLCIALGAAHQTKQIPISILSQICEQVKMKVYLLGGQGDAAKGKELASQFDHVHNVAGTCSLQQSAAILRDSKLLLTGDTGLMHMAVGLSIPTLVLWGNTTPEFGMYPYYGDEKVYSFNHEVKNLSCRPCSKLGKTSCPKGHFKCMKNQNIELIVEQIRSFIDV